MVNDYKNIKNDRIIVDCVSLNYNKPSPIDLVMTFFIWQESIKKVHTINFHHQDFPKNTESLMEILTSLEINNNTMYVFDKKKFVNLTDYKNVNDLYIFEFIDFCKISEDSDYETKTHTFFKIKHHNYTLNQIIPISKHIETFSKKCEHYAKYITSLVDESFLNLNNRVTETLQKIEKEGLCVDETHFNLSFPDKKDLIYDSKVYTEYNIFTSTGRPSNRFGGVNYSALNKDNGCREAFVSRFGDEGFLIGMDYRGYHPHIVANLINYPIDMKVDIYEYLGQLYFNKTELEPEDIQQSKQITFQNFYGGIDERYIEIPFFKKVSEYIHHRWEYFKQNKYVETPVFKRRITENHIVDPNPNKLFNYLLQASETEFSLQNIHEVNDYLKDKESKIVLYVYDSVLIDVKIDEGLDLIKNVKKLMENNQFPVKVTAGPNYNKMVTINI